MRNAYATELGLSLDQVHVSNLTCDGQSYPVPAFMSGSSSNTTSGRRRYRLLLQTAAPLEVATNLQLTVVSQQLVETSNTPNTTSSTDSASSGTQDAGDGNTTTNGTTGTASAQQQQQLQAQVEAIQQQIATRTTALVQQVLVEQFNLTAQVQPVQLLPAVAVVKVGNSTTRLSLSPRSSSTSTSVSGSAASASAFVGPCGGSCSLPNAVTQCGADNICRIVSCASGFSNCNFKDTDGCETAAAECKNSIPLGKGLDGALFAACVHVVNA